MFEVGGVYKYMGPNKDYSNKFRVEILPGHRAIPLDTIGVYTAGNEIEFRGDFPDWVLLSGDIEITWGC